MIETIKQAFETLLGQTYFWPILFTFGGMGIPIFHSDIFFFLLGVKGASLGLAVSCVFSLALGELVLCALARRFGMKFYRHGPLSILMRPHKLLKARTLVNKYGMYALFIARFIPGGRSAIFITLGTLKYPLPAIFLTNILSLSIWCPLLYFSARLMWFEMTDLNTFLRGVLPVLAGLVALFISYQLIRKYFRRKK